jgi:hypothetical protein
VSEMSFESMEDGQSNTDSDGFDWNTMGAPEAEQAEGTPLEEPVEEEPQAPQRERDEKGRFLPQATEEETQEDTPEEAPSGYPPEVAQLIDRFGGDVNKALAYAVEAQKFVGQQGTEVGQLRQTVEQQQQALQQLQAQLAAEAQQYDQEDWQQEYAKLMDEDAAEATIAAYQRLDGPSFNRAYAQWMQDDPVSAKIWMSQEQRLAEQEDRYAKLAQAVEPVIGQVTNTSQQQATQEAVNSVVRENPDLPQYTEAINQVLAENKLLSVAAHGDIPEIKADALRAAYTLAKARTTATQGDAARQLATAQSQASEAAMTDAFVASSANVVREQPTETLADQVTRGWDDISTSHEWSGPGI